MANRKHSTAFGEIWLGDLLKAVSSVRAGTERERMEWGVDLLGLEPGLFVPALSRDGAESGGGPRNLQETVRTRDAGPAAGPTLSPRKRSGRIVAYEIARRFEPETNESGIPTWFVEASELDDVNDEQLESRPPLRPLFRPGTTRALLSTAMATPSGDGDIDLDAVLSAIVRLQPVTELRRHKIASVRLGIQLLVDRGIGMTPFVADRERMIGDIQSVVGRERVEILYFEDSPLRQVDRGDRFGQRVEYQPPAAGTPVVILTDLGIAGRRSGQFGASPEEWMRAARLALGAECPVLVLTPYGQKHWPRMLRAKIQILSWNRATNVSAVRRAIGHGLQIKDAP